MAKDGRRKGVSYRKRVSDINAIYTEQAKLGLSNREIWRRFIYPKYGICERAMYKILQAATNPAIEITDETWSLFNFDEDNG